MSKKNPREKKLTEIVFQSRKQYFRQKKNLRNYFS